MALRDYLNVSTRSELYNFVMQSDQCLLVLGITVAGDIPAEVWYFAAASTATDNGTTVIKPTSIPGGNPGRYLRWIQESDWNYTLNQPTIPAAQVNSDWSAVSGVAQILNKPTNVSSFVNDAGYLIGITSGQIAAALGYTPVTSARTLTINGVAQDLSANRTWSVGDVLTSGSYSNPSWITALAWSKITGSPTTLSGYGITDAVTTARTLTINGSTQDLSSNRTWNVGTVTSVGASITAGLISISGSPVTSSGTISLTYTGTTAQYARGDGSLATLNTAAVPESGNLYYTDARARAAISLTTTGTSGAATYNNSTGVLNIPNYAVVAAPTINSAVSRSLSNAAGSTNQFTISTTRNARVYYSINVTWNISALLSTASTILLEYSTNGGTNWITVNQVSKNINLGLLQSGSDDLNISGEIPANALVRIRPSVSTNSTITYVTGQEVLYN